MRLRSSLHQWISRQWLRRGLWAWLLWPLSWLYGLIVRHRQNAATRHPKNTLAVPVIVIGNIYVGGTGKTPLACELARLLQTQGWHPGLVSRGYGRVASKAGQDHSEQPATGHGPDLDWRQFGDEPALIARKAKIPVSSHRNRTRAAKALLAQYPDTDIIISDDGLQHYALQRDFEILIQDERGIGNGFLLPAGPLREDPKRMGQVDLRLTRISSGSQSHRHTATPGDAAFTLQIESFWQPATDQNIDAASFAQTLALPVAALAAIGVPERFFASLAELGIELAQTHALADHQAIEMAWLENLDARTILITEKDAIKLPAIKDSRIWVAVTKLVWCDDDASARVLAALAAKGIRRGG